MPPMAVVLCTVLCNQHGDTYLYGVPAPWPQPKSKRPKLAYLYESSNLVTTAALARRSKRQTLYLEQACRVSAIGEALMALQSYTLVCGQARHFAFARPRYDGRINNVSRVTKRDSPSIRERDLEMNKQKQGTRKRSQQQQQIENAGPSSSGNQHSLRIPF